MSGAGAAMRAGQAGADQLDDGLLDDVSLAGPRRETPPGTLSGPG